MRIADKKIKYTKDYIVRHDPVALQGKIAELKQKIETLAAEIPKNISNPPEFERIKAELDATKAKMQEA